MFGDDETAETGDGRQSRHEHGLAGAARQNARRALLGEAVEDVYAVGDADADDQRQRHDVRQVERDAEPAHQAGKPECADADGQQRQNHQNHDGNRRQRIPGRVNIAVFEQRFVFVKLHGRAGGILIHRPQIGDEFFLVRTLPHVVLWKNLQ